MNAIVQILEAAYAVGVNIAVEGDQLLLSAPTEPPAIVLDAISEHKPEILALLRSNTAAWSTADRQAVCDERAAIVEFDASVPRDWAEGYSRLQSRPRPASISAGRWLQIIDDSGRLLDKWGGQLAIMGWTEPEIFGVHPAAPTERLDHQGLAMALFGAEIVAITPDTVTVKSGSGRHQRIFRRTIASTGIKIWELET